MPEVRSARRRSEPARRGPSRPRLRRVRHEFVNIAEENSKMQYCVGAVYAAVFCAALACPSLLAAGNDDKVELDGLFSDQGPLYMSPTEPGLSTPVLITLRVFKGDITSADIRYFDTADDMPHRVPMAKKTTDATGR